MKDGKRIIKVTLIIISIIMVLISLSGDILKASTGGAVSLAKFESFYVYIFIIIISLYLAIVNKNANSAICITLITYVWTFILVNQLIDFFTDVNITYELNYYIYLGSAVPLFISLFINEPAQEESNEENNNEIIDIETTEDK